TGSGWVAEGRICAFELEALTEGRRTFALDHLTVDDDGAIVRMAIAYRTQPGCPQASHNSPHLWRLWPTRRCRTCRKRQGPVRSPGVRRRPAAAPPAPRRPPGR